MKKTGAVLAAPENVPKEEDLKAQRMQHRASAVPLSKPNASILAAH
jgi:hypothetical protein